VTAIYTSTILEDLFTDLGLDQGNRLVRRVRIEKSTTGVRNPLVAKDVPALQAVTPSPPLPRPGDVLDGATFAKTSILTTMRCRGVAAFPSPSGAGLLDCEITYDTLYEWRQDYPTSSKAWLPIRSTFRQESRQTYVHRLAPSAPTPASAPGTSDIGGTKVDEGGRPITADYLGGELLVSVTIDTEALALGTEWTGAQAIIGRLNSAAFLGFPAYSLRCVGVDTAHLRDEYWVETFRFNYSELFHCEQQAAAAADGRPDLDTSGRAITVRWRRDSNLASDFNTLFGTGSEQTYRQNRAQNGENG
jgi:hypothetical protein